MFLFFFAKLLVARKVVWATAPQQESIETLRKNSTTEAKTAVAVGVAAAVEVMARYELITCFHEFQSYVFLTIFEFRGCKVSCFSLFLACDACHQL